MPADSQRAALYGQFVEAVYEMFGSEPDSLTPTPQGIPVGYQLVAWIDMSDFTETSDKPMFYGFIAQDENDAGKFVLAIRGTQNSTEWWDNLQYALVPFEQVPNSGSVALGFDKIYQTMTVVDATAGRSLGIGVSTSLRTAWANSFAGQVASTVAHHVKARRDSEQPKNLAPSIVATGHSLGAALATLYTFENVSKSIVDVPTLCTFGSPRVGDNAFAAAFDGLTLESWRIANVPDIVPTLPPESFGYSHVNELIAIDSTGRVNSTITCAHALRTYLAMLDPELKPDPDCEPAATDVRMRDRVAIP